MYMAFTGFYVAGAQAPLTLKMTQEEMEGLIRDDILKGMGESGVKCGVIGEIGCSWPLLRELLLKYVTLLHYNIF